MDGFGLRFLGMTSVPHPAHGTAWTTLAVEGLKSAGIGSKLVKLLATIIPENSDDTLYVLFRVVPVTEIGRETVNHVHSFSPSTFDLAIMKAHIYLYRIPRGGITGITRQQHHAPLGTTTHACLNARTLYPGINHSATLSKDCRAAVGECIGIRRWNLSTCGMTCRERVGTAVGRGEKGGGAGER